MYKVKTIVLPEYYTLMDVAYIYTWKRVSYTISFVFIPLNPSCNGTCNVLQSSRIVENILKGKKLKTTTVSVTHLNIFIISHSGVPLQLSIKMFLREF